jgi:hypothetical protein
LVWVNVNPFGRGKKSSRSEAEGFYRGTVFVTFNQLAGEDARVRYNTILSCRVALDQFVLAALGKSPTERLEDCVFAEKVR